MTCASGLAAWRRFDPLPYLGRIFDPVTWTCWHLVLVFYRDELGIELPRYGVEQYPAMTHLDIGESFGRAKHDGLWREIDFTEERFGDLVTFRHPGLRELQSMDAHVGVVVMPRMMIHVPLRAETEIERHDGIEWRLRRLSLFRHRDMA